MYFLQCIADINSPPLPVLCATRNKVGVRGWKAFTTRPWFCRTPFYFLLQLYGRTFYRIFISPWLLFSPLPILVVNLPTAERCLQPFNHDFPALETLNVRESLKTLWFLSEWTIHNFDFVCASSKFYCRDLLSELILGKPSVAKPQQGMWRLL